MRVDVIDYGAGNLASVVKSLAAVGACPRRVTTPDDIEDSTALVVPGVGHFRATASLDAAWRDAITSRLDTGAALLGICLGMQWLFDGSEEAPELTGLGLFAGRCVRLAPGADLKIPHVGWNTLASTGHPSRLLESLPGISYAYFTHTFAAPRGNGVVATTTHGTTFASVVERGRVFGTQWHPEKSGDTGLRVLKAFLNVAADRP